MYISIRNISVKNNLVIGLNNLQIAFPH